MKNTVSRGILYYVFLLIAVVLGVLCVIGAILMFSPGTEIFGISYYINTSTQSIEKTHLDNGNEQSIDSLFKSASIDVVNITTNYADVSLETRQDGAYKFIIEPSLTGIITSENKNTYSYTCNYSNQTRTLSVSVFAPKMFLAFNNSIDVVLSMPEDVTTTNLDVNISTQSGEVVIGHHELDRYTLKSLSVNVEKSSKVTLGIHTVVTDSISLTVPSGNIRFRREITTNNLTINSTSAKIETGNINADTLSLDTESSSIKIGDVKVSNNFDYSARRGVLLIDNLDGNLNCSDDVIISNITIGELKGDVVLPHAESSNIEIGTLEGIGDITTTSGNVTVENAKSFLWVKTESGKIEVTVNTDEAINTSSYDNDQGVINLATTNGTINVNFSNMLLTNYLKTQKGKINCAFSPTLNLTLNYTCTKYAPTLASGIYAGEPGNEGSITIGNTGTDKNINITNTEGKTDIKDTFIS